MPLGSRSHLLFALAAVALGSSCVAPDEAAPAATRAPAAASVARRGHALGVPQNGFPSWNEAVIYMLTNRARSDPPAELAATCTVCQGVSYPVAKPLAYDYNLARAARFQATSMRLAGSGLQHASVCKLVANLGAIYPSICDGSPSCACEGGSANCTCTTTPCSGDSDCGADGRCDLLHGHCYYCKCGGDLCTSTAARVSRFGGAYHGENAAAGRSDPRLTFAQWINSSGHRDNLMNGSHGAIGTGQYAGTGKCWSNFWVQVFGFGGQRPTVAGGVAYPQRGKATTSFDFTAVYYDQLGAAPAAALVNIDGACDALALERGVAAHGSYHLQRSGLAAGCHRYYFVFRAGSGALQTFPSQGSYGVGVDDPSCAFYDSARPALGAGCGCSSDADCDDGNGCTRDRCANSVCSNTALAGCSDGGGPPDAAVGPRDGGDDRGAATDDGHGGPPRPRRDGTAPAADRGPPRAGAAPGGDLIGMCAVGARPQSALPLLLLLVLWVVRRVRRR